MDFVVFEDMKYVKKALAELGFKEKKGYFCCAGCPWLVEFVSGPAAVGKEIIKRFNEMEAKTGTIKMLRPEDAVKDRLSSYFHWRDKQSLQQAIDICLENKLKYQEIKLWADKEGFSNGYKEFKESLRKRRAAV